MIESIAQTALEVARSQVGVRESGRNRGTEVERYLASVGLPPGQPWCAAFVYWCFLTAALRLERPNRWAKTGTCERIRLWAKRWNKLVLVPQPGDVFLVMSKGRARHTGFVEKALPHGRIATIEGNTNLDGSAEGLAVCSRTRSTPGLLFTRL